MKANWHRQFLYRLRTTGRDPRLWSEREREILIRLVLLLMADSDIVRSCRAVETFVAMEGANQRLDLASAAGIGVAFQPGKRVRRYQAAARKPAVLAQSA